MVLGFYGIDMTYDDLRCENLFRNRVISCAFIRRCTTISRNQRIKACRIVAAHKARVSEGQAAVAGSALLTLLDASAARRDRRTRCRRLRARVAAPARSTAAQTSLPRNRAAG